MGLNIELFWQKPIQLTSRGKLVGDEDQLANQIEKNQTGVYAFSRKHGPNLIPFYIGQSSMLRGRLRAHLKRNVSLMRVSEGYGEDAEAIGQGSRYFQYAVITSKKNIKKTLDIVERALIRKAIADDYLILNKNFSKIDKHTVISLGQKSYRAIFDRTTSVESQN